MTKTRGSPFDPDSPVGRVYTFHRDTGPQSLLSTAGGQDVGDTNDRKINCGVLLGVARAG